MFWLGKERGYLTDWITQLWVRWTGRRIDLSRNAWLEGLVGETTGIGLTFFHDLAKAQSLEVRQGHACGLLADFAQLRGPRFEPTAVKPRVRHFYEQTSGYDLDAWAHWCGVFRPFGWLLAFLFSRRLQQLNVPLSGLDTSRGISSEVIQLVHPATGQVLYMAWVRQLLGSGNVLYAGSYSVCQLPGHSGPCVKVVFPLPNGNAMVLMRPEAHADGSFTVTREYPRLPGRSGGSACRPCACLLRHHLPAAALPATAPAHGRSSRLGPAGAGLPPNRRCEASA